MHATIDNRSQACITDTIVPTSFLPHRERLRSHESSFEVPPRGDRIYKKVFSHRRSYGVE